MTYSPTRRHAALMVTAPALALLVLAALPGVASAHYDHAPPAAGGTSTPFTYAESGGEGAVWEPLTSIPTGNPHSDLDFFTQGGETFASVGTLAVGANAGGQSIIQLTEGGKVSADTPSFVSGHGSADCLSNPRMALGLQHDAEVTPKGDTINNDSYLPAVPEDAQLLIDTTDASGRCHDQGALVDAPRGGLEIIDITDVENPVEIALTANIGEAHTVNIDPKRPHIAYAVTSDGVSVSKDDNGTPDDPADDTFKRSNEPGGTTDNLDGFEVVDMSSCMYKTAAVPAGTLDPAIKDLPREEAVAAKRAACKPEVYRYRYENLDMSLGYSIKTGIFGCHELQPYPNDTLTCGSGAAAIVFDMSAAFDAQGTPQGEPLDCLVRKSSSTPAFQTGADITDCTVKSDGATSLGVRQWLEDGAPSLAGVEHVGSQHHIGRAPALGFATTIPATEDIDFNHETEFTQSGRFLLATDERGGGVLGGAQCSQGESNEQVNGGVHAYRTDKLTTGPATTAEQADAGYAQSYTGDPEAPLTKAIYRAPTRTGAEGSFCTAHVFQQVPEQNRIFMGWYTQGTQVVDYVELPGSKLQMLEVGYAIPTAGAAGAKPNTWASAIFKKDENPDGSFTYYGATGDIQRLAIDIYKVTLPAPLEVCDLQSGTGERAKESTVSDRSKARGVHVQNVDCVLNYKISQGKTASADGTPATYAPTERVSRGQMASFIANALIRSRDDDGVLPAAGGDQFSDIGSNTHRVAINRLAQAGIVKGLTGPGGRFAPEQLISRDQMASFIAEAARFAGGGLEPTRTDYFRDVPAGNVHERNISAGFEAGLFQGTVVPGSAPRSGTFDPRTQVQRDQMATFLVRLFKNTLK